VTNNSSRSVENYFNALRDRDMDAVAGLLHDEAREIIPLAPNGAPDAWFDFRGKDEVLNYVGTIFNNFSQVEIVDREVSVTEDGRTVFVEAKGDLIVADGGASYRNVYVFRFSFDGEGLITEIREYANPVPIAPILGVPVG
jgi:ketosteroid isomerase-like protein